MTTPQAETFLKQKAKEKGIEPIYPEGFPVPEEEQDPNLISMFFSKIVERLGIKNNVEGKSLIDDIDAMVNHKLNVLDTGQTTMKFQINEIIVKIERIESKLDKLVKKK